MGGQAAAAALPLPLLRRCSRIIQPTILNRFIITRVTEDKPYSVIQPTVFRAHSSHIITANEYTSACKHRRGVIGRAGERRGHWQGQHLMHGSAWEEW